VLILSVVIMVVVICGYGIYGDDYVCCEEVVIDATERNVCSL
jgi:hypothetical protein